ncbi:GyrI-like domain-containing protein [Clostridium beijerinckii]|uniref:GyrI-like domain-containing protein n=1 Tax=Clostridium beijerinckii TaxID=1520 RepID=UPI0002F1DF56|nr:GyrI-like domain-containing protein [Clostridium beijerinckii]
MKYEWRKEEKEIYLAKEKPALVKVPKAKYFCIKGKGNPNDGDFSNRIAVLYSLAYAVRMMPKSGFIPDGYFEYTVYPLEGLWDMTEVGKSSEVFNKDELIYTIMIKQPDFVNEEVVKKAFEIANKKKADKLLEEAYFDEIEDGLSVQMLHIGSYDNEPETFSKMKDYINENNLKIKSLVHREIYLSDARKVEIDKLKTVLRYTVTK